MAAEGPPAHPPTLTFIAGSNGAGKTTLARVLERVGALRGITVVNSDTIARRINPSSPEAAAFQAGREAIQAVSRHRCA